MCRYLYFRILLSMHRKLSNEFVFITFNSGCGVGKLTLFKIFYENCSESMMWGGKLKTQCKMINSERKYAMSFPFLPLILYITCLRTGICAISPSFFAYQFCSPTVIVWFSLNPSIPNGTALSIEKLMPYKKWKEHRKVS